MRKSWFLLVAASVSLVSCGIPEARLRAGLIRAGVHPRMAECMAGRMAARLSIAQLRRIGDLPEARHSGSVEDFLHNVRALDDSQILGVTSSSAALCATGLVH